MIRLVLRVVSLALAAAAIAGAIAVGALLPAAPGPTTQTVRDAGVVTDLPAAPAAPSAPQARK